MTDTPPQATDTPVRTPPTRYDLIKSLLGDLARPYAIYVTSTSAAIVPVIVVARVAPDRLELIGAAAFIGALFAGVGGIFTAKAWENNTQAKQQAQVAIEQAKAASSAP